MIEILGKRPFANRADDMDKWLDQNAGKSAPPPLEQLPPSPGNNVDDPTPSPAMAKALNMDVRRPFGPF